MVKGCLLPLYQIEELQVNYEFKEVLFETENVTLRYGETQILNRIDLKIRNVVRPGVNQGQVVGLLGPSGVGKSQLSHILAGLQSPTTGTVKVADKSGNLVPVTPGSVGYVFQNYPLFRHRTVLGNLLVALEKTPIDKKAKTELALAELEQFGLGHRAYHYPEQLSGGQRQRVAILQQLLGAGHFLIMDEPFTGLDPIMKDKVCDLIRKISTVHEETTLFIIAHDIAALVEVSDQLILLGKDTKDQGAYVKKTYNLIEEGFAWNPAAVKTEKFHTFVEHVKGQFKHLSAV